MREATKQLNKLEQAIQKLAEEKRVLLAWFEENYTEFSEEKTKRLAQIEKEITDKESDWMELEEELEVLNGEG